MKYKKLFEKGKIGKLTIKNRIVMPPMGTGFAAASGEASEEITRYYEERAKGGVGLIITGANWVDNNIEVHSPGSFPCPTICPGKYIKAARELTDRVHAFDTKIFV